MRREVQHLLLIADEEVARTRNKPAEKAPVEVAEEQNERGERDRGGEDAPHEIAPRPERDVCEHQTEPDRHEPRTRREPRERAHERARECEIANRRRRALADEADDGDEHERGNEIGVDLGRVRDEGMDEDGRGHREERDAPVECEVPQQEVQLRRKERAEQAEEGKDSGAARERIRDHRKDGQAHVPKRVDRVADVDPVDIR